ncbi:MAG TPA: hypothetical protein VLD19_14650 [Chitinophagaceae bacterium]|nr:hypothetical protein [Chitinophagaceae bacterium]
MKPLLIFLAVTLFCPPAFSQFHYFFSDSSTNPPSIIAAQHIKRDSIFSCTLHGKKVIDSSLRGVEEYNADGTIATQTEVIGGKAMIVIVDSFFYNAGGRLVKRTMGNRGKRPFSIHTIDYDSNGLDIGGYDDDTDVKGGRNCRARKEYNSAGRLSKKYLQWDGEEMYLYNQYAYDNEGRLSEVMNYDKNGNILSSTLYEYTDGNRCKTIYRRTSRGTKKDLIFYYNQQGRCTRIDCFYLKETWKYRFYYYPNGTLAEYKAVKGKKEETHRHHYSKD